MICVTHRSVLEAIVCIDHDHDATLTQDFVQQYDSFLKK